MPSNATQRTIDHQLSFLRTDLGYTLIRTEVNAEYCGANLLVYRSEKAAKQLEISADDGYFHCEIRRIIAGRPAAYEDGNNDRFREPGRAGEQRGLRTHGLLRGRQQ